MHNDELRENKLDEITTTSLYINTFMEYTNSLKTLGEPICERSKRSLFLNQIVELDYAITHEILKSSKSLATLEECLIDIWARKDNLECKSLKEHKSMKIKRVYIW